MIITVPTTETTLYDLLGGDQFCAEIFLQAPLANNDVINFGPVNEVHHFLVTGETAVLPVNDLKTYAIKGNNPADQLIITVYRK